MGGTIQNRDAFLDKIAANLGRERKKKIDKPEYKHNPQSSLYEGWSTEQLMHMFKEHCAKIHTDYYSTTKKDLDGQLREAITTFGGGPIIIGDDDRFTEYGCDPLLQSLPAEGIPVYKWDPEMGEENILLAEKANIGINFSEITLAESGTVVLFSSPKIGRSISLLPTTFIAIIPKSTLVPRMTQAAKRIKAYTAQGKTVPACINFITGPSNSADIEMNLVVGVHGPVKAAYIVVEDC
ncbi:LutC/YkgG family protein [Bacillus sp. 1P06AnD]|uniref:LutC/YkgG family protein n=1 Tax=Bacillus sp. 1P06AnD TaxID=3132208 RepID=UPI00399F1882